IVDGDSPLAVGGRVAGNAGDIDGDGRSGRRGRRSRQAGGQTVIGAGGDDDRTGVRCRGDGRAPRAGGGRVGAVARGVAAGGGLRREGVRGLVGNLEYAVRCRVAAGARDIDGVAV